MSYPTQGSQEWKAWRRHRAYELKQSGKTQKEIAKIFGVTEGAVSQWMSRAHKGGVEALARRKPPGASGRLTPEQLLALREMIREGAKAAGFEEEWWDRARVKTLIEQRFSVSYSLQNISKILNKIGVTLQKPTVKSPRRDEEAIRRWRDERWPALKKKPMKKAGESSF